MNSLDETEKQRLERERLNKELKEMVARGVALKKKRIEESFANSLNTMFMLGNVILKDLDK